MDFIRSKVQRDVESGKYGGRVATRFPPEPNGFLHIGHAKSICLNFGIAAEHEGGRCHLRLDDTNPDTEKAEYVEAMKRDIRWLGFDWGERLHHASDYFERFFQCALKLIDRGKAFVDSCSEEEIRAMRGSVATAGTESPWRGRCPAENRELFMRMKAGEFPDGSHVLRARIDMSHPNMAMRDPILFRIRHARHYHRGDAWSIYPLYDFAHCLSDFFEGITHSLCTLEFENNRAVYNWILESVEAPPPRPEQTEFAPLSLDYVVVSKRKLRLLVDKGIVRGWDDPRMPTLAGLRRRGVPPGAIRKLCRMVGVTRNESRTDAAKLDYAIRAELEPRASRAFGILDPLLVEIENFEEIREPVARAASLPDARRPGQPRKAQGQRRLPLERKIWIERGDFSEEGGEDFRRLTPAQPVRLRYGWAIRLREIVRDEETGEALRLRCEADPDSKGARPAPGFRPRAAIHWLGAKSAVPARIRLLDRLFTVADPLSQEDFLDAVNPSSERMVDGWVEAGLSGAEVGSRFQFERLGYFAVDADSSRGSLVFNRIATLRERPTKARRKENVEKETTRTAAEDAGETRESEGSSGRAAWDPPEDSAERARYDALIAGGATQAAAASVARSSSLFSLFEAALPHCSKLGGALANHLANDVRRAARQEGLAGAGKLTAEGLAALTRAREEGELSVRQTREGLRKLVTDAVPLSRVLEARGTEEITDEGYLRSELRKLVRRHPGRARAYASGRKGLLGFFVGRIMQSTKGRADPRLASKIARELLGK